MIWFTAWIGVLLGVMDIMVTTENIETFKHYYECSVCSCCYVVEHDEETLYIDSCPECGSEENNAHEIT